MDLPQLCLKPTRELKSQNVLAPTAFLLLSICHSQRSQREHASASRYHKGGCDDPYVHCSLVQAAKLYGFIAELAVRQQSPDPSNPCLCREIGTSSHAVHISIQAATQHT